MDGGKGDGNNVGWGRGGQPLGLCLALKLEPWTMDGNERLDLDCAAVSRSRGPMAHLSRRGCWAMDVVRLASARPRIPT